MKKLGLLMMLLLLSRIALFCQAQTAGIEEKEVLRNEDVIFHQIDEHTWFGTGHLMANESLYLVEGETKAILIDAGTKIKDLDKLVAFAGRHACASGPYRLGYRLFPGDLYQSG